MTSPRIAGREAEIERLYVEEGWSLRDIAEHLGFKRDSTRSLAKALMERGVTPRGRNQWGPSLGKPHGAKALARPKPDPKKCQRARRRCLMCGAGFTSSWAGERVCRACKGSVAWREGC